ncbi:MAG: hypothetical protein H3Z52_13745, partial [archaeon]|nr:hypothetical protein [archaeon]
FLLFHYAVTPLAQILFSENAIKYIPYKVMFDLSEALSNFIDAWERRDKLAMYQHLKRFVLSAHYFRIEDSWLTPITYETLHDAKAKKEFAEDLRRCADGLRQIPTMKPLREFRDKWEDKVRLRERKLNQFIQDGDVLLVYAAVIWSQHTLTFGPSMLGQSASSRNDVIANYLSAIASHLENQEYDKLYDALVHLNERVYEVTKYE